MVWASRRNPQFGPPELGMANAWSAQGDAAKAREWFDRAVAAQPDSFAVRIAFAQWLVNQKNLADAKVHIDAAAKMRPQAREVIRLRAVVDGNPKP